MKKFCVPLLALVTIIVMSTPTIFYEVTAEELYVYPPTVQFSSGYGKIENGSIVFDRGDFNITWSEIPPDEQYTLTSGGKKIATVNVAATKADYRVDWQEQTFRFSSSGPFTLTGIPYGNRSIQVAFSIGGHQTLGSSTNPSSFSLTTTQRLNFLFEAPPAISVATPENRTYNNGTLPLNFSINGYYVKLCYSVDNLPKTEITGNTTLTELTSGNHSLVIYATDSFDNTVTSRNVYFTISAGGPFSTWVVAVLIMVIVAIAITSVL